MKVKFEGIPQTIGQGNIARNVHFNESVWIAEMDIVPQGAIEITEEEYSNLAAEIDSVEPEIPPVQMPPDPGNLLLSIFQTFGPSARSLATKYPDFQIGLNYENWVVARGAVESALAQGDLTQQQYDTIQTLMEQNGIPES